MANQTALNVLQHALESRATDLVVVYADDQNGLAVSWSTMPLEKLVYLKAVLDTAINSRLASAIMAPAEETPAPEKPAVIRRRRSPGISN